MKCEKCGNEANFFYQVSVNGQKAEVHLCTECAQKAGLLQPVNTNARPGFGGFFDDPFDWFDDFWGTSDRFFGRSFFPSFGLGRGLTTLMPVLPRIEFKPENKEEKPEETKAEAETETGTEVEVDPELKTRRELQALKNQLEEAVKAEDFEKAITLRDQIREMEGK